MADMRRSNRSKTLALYYDPRLERLFISEKIKITQEAFEPDAKMEHHVSTYVRQFEEKLNKYIGCSSHNLEARFSRLRT